MLLQKNDTLVMIGDSITDCGRARPVGDGGGLGEGYVKMVDAMLGAVYPAERIRVRNTGISGNTVRDLVGRWQADVFDLKPNWVSIMIGTNDVWRQFDSPKDPKAGVPLDEYELTLAKLVDLTAPRIRGMVLMTPFFIEPLKTDAMRDRMDEYGAAVKRVADAKKCVFVDTQAAFDAVLAYEHSSAISWDRVHPGAVGHMILARAFLKGIGFTGF